MNFSEYDFEKMIYEVERELGQRLRVYKNLINKGSMTRNSANQRYKLMSMVLEFLKEEKEKRFPIIDLYSDTFEKGGAE